jgi:hypothetical protein
VVVEILNLLGEMLSDDQIVQIDQEFAKQGKEGNKPAASQQFGRNR